MDLALNKLQRLKCHKSQPASNIDMNWVKYEVIEINISSAFNKFPDFFVQAFKIVVDSWKFCMLLLYILWDDRPIFMISGSNEHLLQEL